MSDLGPIEEDVRFDHGAAERLISLCNAAATTVEGQAGSRASWVTTGLQDFAGSFARLFASNARTASADATEVATRLRDVARFTTTLAEEATSEQRRREKAREWQRQQADRSLWDKGVDTVGGWLGAGEDKPPVGPMPTPSSFAPTPVSPAPRQTPPPGSGGGGGGGTSSARPENLRAFASGSRGANREIRSRPTGCRTAYDSFVAGCGWGHLEASGVFSGFDRYVDANEEDVEWATTVGDAFARAGGEGAVSTLSNSALAAALRAAGVDASRDDIVVDPPTAYGTPPTSGYADDPVNAASGNFLENEADLGFAGGCGDLALTRTYNSFDTRSGGFGPGWSSWTETGLELTDESARMRLPDGRVVVFPRLGDGWDRATGESLWLERSGDGLVVTGNDGTTWEFSAEGLLRRRHRGEGSAVRLVHDDEHRLVRLEHERGRSIALTWEGGLVVGAATSDGRRATYEHDERGRLVAVTTPLGTRRYGWDDERDLVTSVTDADGVVEAQNSYDDRRRVVRQRSAHGRVSRLVYLPGNVTVVSDEDGARSNTWISDHRGRVIGIVDADEQRISTAYDGHGNPVLVTERDGATTVHEYDDRGRRVRTVTPSGADLTFGHDELDRVRTVVTEAGAVTTYDYDGASRNPSVVTDPEGGVSRLTWSAGLLTRIVDPTGVVVSFEHDAHGDLVATTDALGNTARLERDVAGRVRAAVTPSGARTTFDYGPSGLVSGRRDPDGARWRFEHTAAGRLSATIDPTGARTHVERDEAGEAARTTDALGRVVSRTLDDLGNLASAELPDGSTWEFTHDALSRLVATTDPTGATWSREHDEGGRVVVTVDPTGVRHAVSRDRVAGTVGVDDGEASLSTGFDPLGRMTSAGQADGSAVMATYDRCGRPVELLDGEGGLTTIERDAAGKPVTVTSPTGAVSRRDYDVCGRLVAIVDPTGGRTTLAYDADGRVVRRTLPSGDVATTDHDDCGRVVAQRVPGRGVARYRYDAAGRVVESSDTWHGRRRFRYDAAGQLVEVTNGNGGVTRYDYDTNGRNTAITDPLGHTTHREFDAMNRCVAETDPLGRTTRAGYDAAGRLAWQTGPDGVTTRWIYDAAGRLAATSVDDRAVATIERDLRHRRVTVTDHTSPSGRAMVHTMQWDRRGRLVNRSRDDQELTWTYDADGRRRSMTTPDGLTTTYGVDAAGRLATVDHPLLGRVVLDRDADGRVVAATAGGTVQAWQRHDGFVVGHSVTDSEGATATVVTRNDWGRVVSVEHDGEPTAYDYDDAGQLVDARTERSVTTYDYDASGRLVREATTDGADVIARDHGYDAAGQLLTTTDAIGTTRHTYDPVGRRTRTAHADGRVRDLAWSPSGRLAGVTDHDLDGRHRSELHVDVLGELAGVDGAPLWWDTADAYAPRLVQADDVPVVAAGPVTGLGEAWSAPGWRTARSAGRDPWEPAGGLTLPGGLRVGASGELTLGGAGDPLEWLGARVYDPASRGFLSVDPLDPTPGAGAAGNPYSYAGNDPLHALDPTGLKPLTDAELDAYIESTQGFLHAAGEWVSDNWEYVAGGAMVIAGAALMIAPVPGVAQAAGAALISAGADTIIQKATTGEVNWGQVAVSGAAGAVGFGVGGLAMRAGATGVRAAVVSGVSEGALGGGGSYLAGPGPHTPTGLVRSTAMGGATGALPVPGGAGDNIVSSAGRHLDDVAPTPPRATFITDADGTVIPTSRATLEGGFRDAGFPSSPTRSPGTDYTLPDGSHVRVMDASGQAPQRASFENANGQPVDAFSGKPVQPPPGLTAAERREYIRERTHVELDP